MPQRMGLLHGYGQRAHHDELYIVGDRAGLVQLRDALDQALGERVGRTLVMTADGEGYDVIVLCCDSGWERLRLPYTADWLVQRERNKAHPADLLLGKPET